MTKICRICHQEKPLTAFCPRAANSSTRRNECNRCKYLLGKGLLVPWHPPADARIKRCRGCDEWLLITAFTPYPNTKHPNRRDHLCKACTKQYFHDRYMQNRAQYIAKQQANRDKDPEAFRAAFRQAQKRRYDTNPITRQRMMERNIENRTRRRGLPFIEPVNLDVLFARDKGICGLCHERVNRRDASRDHIIPAADGGEYSYRNMQLAHKWCNSRKGHRRKIPSQLRMF